MECYLQKCFCTLSTAKYWVLWDSTVTSEMWQETRANTNACARSWVALSGEGGSPWQMSPTGALLIAVPTDGWHRDRTCPQQRAAEQTAPGWRGARLCSAAASLPQYIFFIQYSSVPSVTYFSSLRTLINVAHGQIENSCKGCSAIKQENWLITALCPTPCILSPTNSIQELVKSIHQLFVSSHTLRTGSPQAERYRLLKFSRMPTDHSEPDFPVICENERICL